MPPTADLLAKSVQPRPPLLIPPRCSPGSKMTAVLPARATSSAAMTPPDVPPYTQTSASKDRADSGREQAERTTAAKVCRSDMVSFLLIIDNMMVRDRVSRRLSLLSRGKHPRGAMRGPVLAACDHPFVTPLDDPRGNE